MIPKIIHQIWLTEKQEYPQHMQKWSNSFIKYNPDFKYNLWNERSLDKEFDLSSIYETYQISNIHPVLKVNVLRMLVIQKFGGFYFDTDCECFSGLSELVNYDFITNMNGYNHHIIGYNNFFGSIQDSNMINKCVSYMLDNIPNINTNMEFKCGWKVFNDIIFNYADKDTRILSNIESSKYFKHYFTKEWCKM